MSKDYLEDNESLYPLDTLNYKSILPSISKCESSISEIVESLDTDSSLFRLKHIRKSIGPIKESLKLKSSSKKLSQLGTIRKPPTLSLPSVISLKKRVIKRNILNPLSNHNSSGFFLTEGNTSHNILNTERIRHPTEPIEIKNIKGYIKKKETTITEAVDKINVDSSKLNYDIINEGNLISSYNRGMIIKCQSFLSNLDKKNNINTDEFIEEGLKEKKRFNFYKSLDLIISKLHNVDYATMQRILFEMKNQNGMNRQYQEKKRKKLHNKVIKILDSNEMTVKRIVKRNCK